MAGVFFVVLLRTYTAAALWLRLILSFISLYRYRKQAGWEYVASAAFEHHHARVAQARKKELREYMRSSLPRPSSF